jgi:hypothetical protein
MRCPLVLVCAILDCPLCLMLRSREELQVAIEPLGKKGRVWLGGHEAGHVEGVERGF